MGVLTKAEIQAEVDAGRLVILRNGDQFTVVDTDAEVPASDGAISTGLTDIVVQGLANAGNITFTPAGGIAATTVQDAIEELDAGGGSAGNFQADVTWADGVDVAVGTTTGTKIGTAATQKIGFWNKTPIVQPSGASQTALDDQSTGVASVSYQLVDVTSSPTQATINANFATVAVLLNALRTALVNAGIIKGSA